VTSTGTVTVANAAPTLTVSGPAASAARRTRMPRRSPEPPSTPRRPTTTAARPHT
jgi:hypothetical protein